ncbi:MAG: ABC transporter ATP-binding protein/permease [Defluviitaleaceae bacterium]|nr:ABC transporter ATP-binding protein/permease [Defluviitaleaceae bacterium]
MKKTIYAYTEILSIMYRVAPIFLIGVVLLSILQGVISFTTITVTANLLDKAINLSDTGYNVLSLLPDILLFATLLISAPFIEAFYFNSYAIPKTNLIFRTSLREKLIKKLSKIKYEHLEDKNSLEIIDKTFSRIENAAKHLFPMYLQQNLSAIVFSIGTLVIFANVRWWLVITILLPFFIEVYLSSRLKQNIYDEMESYWEKDQSYNEISNMLYKRHYVKENRIFQNANYLISKYQERIGIRNKEYEHFFFKNFKSTFYKSSLLSISSLINAVIILWLFYSGYINIGLMITLTITLFGTLLGWNGLMGSVLIIMWSGVHSNAFDFYKKFKQLSEKETNNTKKIDTTEISIEFDNVWFKYPNTDKYILKGISFIISTNEKIAIVGENGEGKTTIIKLLLGLFSPDKGEIKINRKSIYDWDSSYIFGTVMQDFNKYNLTLRENIAISSISDILNDDKLNDAKNIFGLDINLDTLLGKEFEGGTDLSGGEWQRIALARAFFCDRPVLILDEPSSQLDPIAEKKLYEEFLKLIHNKTAIFITHRLAAATIMDNILVIKNGIIFESGNHNELMKNTKLYYDMYTSQNKFFRNDNYER